MINKLVHINIAVCKDNPKYGNNAIHNTPNVQSPINIHIKIALSINIIYIFYLYNDMLMVYDFVIF